METIAVTIKTISAMVALKPVVTPAYFHAFLTAALKVSDYCYLNEAIRKRVAMTDATGLCLPSFDNKELDSRRH